MPSVNAILYYATLRAIKDAEAPAPPVSAPAAAPVATPVAASPAPAAASAAADEDFDLFGEEDETEHEKEMERRAAEALRKAEAKNAAKGIVQKSVVIIDVKPWEDTTDLGELEKKVREITIDGLEWKAAQLKPIGYGIKKLVISAHVEDAKVSIDDVQEAIQQFEDFVQSTDIASFTKL